MAMAEVYDEGPFSFDEDEFGSSDDDGDDDDGDDGDLFDVQFNDTFNDGSDVVAKPSVEVAQPSVQVPRSSATVKKATDGMKVSTSSNVYTITALATMKGDKPYNCDICGSSFVEKRSVYRHISIVHRKTVQVIGNNGSIVTTMVHGKSVPHGNGSAIVKSSPVDIKVPERPNGHTTGTVQGIKRVNGKAAVEKHVKFAQKPPTYQTLPFKSVKKPFEYSIPYRCLFEDCTSQFPDKESMVNHMMESHQRILMLEKVSTMAVANNIQINIPQPQKQPTHAASPPVSAASVQLSPEKPFNCPHAGCFSSYTRSTRLKEHIRKHHSLDTSTTSRSTNSSNYSSSFSSTNGNILKVKLSLPKSLPLPPIQSFNSSPSMSAFAESTKVSNSRGSSTIHPKKYHCDFPGCDKVYTKSSHVKRHKDSVHAVFSLEPICQITEGHQADDDDGDDDDQFISGDVFDEEQVDQEQVLEEPKAKKVKQADAPMAANVQSNYGHQCDQCPKKFTRKSDLTRHVNNKHGNNN